MSNIREKFSKSDQIGKNPKIKLLKKNAKQRSSLENLEQDSLIHELDELIRGGPGDEDLLTENKNITHLKGKYERYWLDRARNIIHKDILIIQPEGKVVIRSLKNIYFGEARYVLNSLLQIHIESLNEEQDMALTLLSFVGRHEFSDITCLHAYSLSASSDNTPQCHYEIMIPIAHPELLTLPQSFEVDSKEFVKLKFRYPELYTLLSRVNFTPPAKVDWH